MRRLLLALGGALVLGALAGTPAPAQARDVTFLSTQMRPIEEAQRMRTEVLKAAPVPVTFVPEGCVHPFRVR